MLKSLTKEGCLTGFLLFTRPAPYLWRSWPFPTGRGFQAQLRIYIMDKIQKQALQVAKEIVVKFIEVGRISPSNFSEHF